jgi:tetratricopeptide (TPR) repeat protein
MRFIFLTFAIIYFSQVSLAKSENAFELGLNSAKNKEYNQARIYFQEFLKSNKQDANTLYNLGLIEFQSNNFSTAIWYFERSLKINPELKDSRLQIERAYKKLNTDKVYEAPNSIFISKLFEIKLKYWSWIALISSLFLSVLIVLSFIKKRFRTQLIYLQFLLGFLLVFCIYVRTKKDIYMNSLSHAIIKNKIENTYVDKSGNAIENLTLSNGDRLEINQIHTQENRISLYLDGGKEIFLDLDKVLLF